MVPSSSLSVLFFLALVTPGLVFELLWESRKVRPKESTFREISRVVLASFAFSTASLMLLGLAAVVCSKALPSRWTILPDPARWLRDGSSYLADHYLLISAALVVQTLLASGLAWFAYAMLTRGETARLSHVSAWWQAFRQRNPTTAAPRVRIRLKNGTVFVGLLGDYTASSVPVGEREVVLYPPLWSKTERNALTELPADWHCVILSGGDVESIAVQYRESGPRDPDVWNAHDKAG